MQLQRRVAAFWQPFAQPALFWPHDGSILDQSDLTEETFHIL
jgi:hypothetical protein